MLGRRVASVCPWEPAAGVSSTRAGALRRRTGGPGSSESRGADFGAAAAVLESLELLPVEEELRVNRGRSGSSVEIEEDDELEEEFDDDESELRLRTGWSESLVELPDVWLLEPFSCRVILTAW